MKSVLTLVAVAMLSSVTMAQRTYIPRFGMNYSTITYTNNFATTSDIRRTESIPATPGFYAGLAVDMRISKRFAFRPEVLFTAVNLKRSENVDYRYQGSYINNFNTVQRIENRRYVSIPLQLVYYLDVGPGTLHVSAGEYTSIALTGHVKDTETTKEYPPSTIVHTNVFEGDLIAGKDPATALPTYYYNNVDIGIAAGVGYEYKRVIVSVNYNYGLTNTAPHYVQPQFPRDSYIYHNRIFSFGLAYRIGSTEVPDEEQ